METVVQRVRFVRGSEQGRDTLEQRFEFAGDGVDADAIADVLLNAPLTGENSVFGNRPGKETARTDGSRSMVGFSPAPGFRFDVAITPHDRSFHVRFTQPDRTVPYLQGDLLWSISDETHGAVFDEQINTQQALAVLTEPLTGDRRSLRRWLFFRMGHKQVMSRATRNLGDILNHTRG